MLVWIFWPILPWSNLLEPSQLCSWNILIFSIWLLLSLPITLGLSLAVLLCCISLPLILASLTPSHCWVGYLLPTVAKTEWVGTVKCYMSESVPILFHFGGVQCECRILEWDLFHSEHQTSNTMSVKNNVIRIPVLCIFCLKAYAIWLCFQQLKFHISLHWDRLTIRKLMVSVLKHFQLFPC